MQLVGMIFVASWLLISIMPSILAYLFDKLRGVDERDAMISTGLHDSRISAIKIVIFSLPVLGIGIILNAIGYYF